MRFKLQHSFKGISLADFEALYFNEKFNEALCERLRLPRNVLELENDGVSLLRRIQCTPERDLPGPLKKLIADGSSYEEIVKYTWGSMKAEWETIPSMMADKVSSKGEYSFTQDGDSIVREVSGDIEVKVFGVGKIAEKFLIAEAEKSFDDAALFTQRWIDERA